MKSTSSHKHRKYSCIPYDPAWATMFTREAETVRQQLGNKALAIEHIGSTSVPGLAGKPTIDILVLVDDPTAIDHVNGYQSLGEYVLPGARLFVKEEANVRLVNLHVFPKDHPHVREMLQLRDYLRTHPETVKEYSDLKFELANKFPNDYAQYRKYKDEYVAALQQRIHDRR